MYRSRIFGEMLAEKAKLVFKVNTTGAAVLGLGYIVGLKYASIICAGSLAVWWIIIPIMSMIWGEIPYWAAKEMGGKSTWKPV